MKSTDLRNLTEAEIEQMMLSIKEQLFKLRTENQSGQPERPHKFRLLKRDMARCLTILKEKERGKK